MSSPVGWACFSGVINCVVALILRIMRRIPSKLDKNRLLLYFRGVASAVSFGVSLVAGLSVSAGSSY